VTSRDLPLAGLRIIEIATYVAGPSGGMTLAQLGADVIRIDPVGGATDTRRLPLDSAGHSLYWIGLNKGKRSVEIDLSSVEGRSLVSSLVASSGPGGGIVLTNALGRRWPSYDALRQHRHDLIHVHVIGRNDGSPAIDHTVNCEVGLPLLTGPGGFEPPVNHVLPAWDLLSGLHAALGIVVADRVRSRTGEGQFITVSLADVAVTTMAHLGFVADVSLNSNVRVRDGNYLYGSFGCDFVTRDGQRLMIAALTGNQWRSLVAMTAMEPTISALEQSLDIDLGSERARYDYREMLAALLRPWFAARTRAEVIEAAQIRRLPCGSYRSVEELVRDPNALLAECDLFDLIHQPGVGTFPIPRSVLRMSESSVPAPVPAPRLGEHTEEVLATLLALSPSSIAELRRRGIVGREA
jgi:2-methylfumaryl-CoA isomerase